MTQTESLKIQAYTYGGWHNDTGKPGEIIYVDLANMNPDPCRQLLWGYDAQGDLRSGDYLGFFTKVGHVHKFEYQKVNAMHATQQKQRHEKIVKAIEYIKGLTT